MTDIGSIVTPVLSIVVEIGSGIQAVAHHGIVFSVAVGVHGPHILRAIVIAGKDLIVEIEVEPHIGPCLGLIEEGRTHLALHAVNNGRHRILGIRGQRRLKVVHLQRC